jgi:hypothetical protein
MLLFHQVATRLSLTTCWQIVELQDDNKLLEQQPCNNFSTSWEQAVRTHLVDKLLEQHCYKSAAGLLCIRCFRTDRAIQNSIKLIELDRLTFDDQSSRPRDIPHFILSTTRVLSVISSPCFRNLQCSWPQDTNPSWRGQTMTVATPGDLGVWDALRGTFQHHRIAFHHLSVLWGVDELRSNCG